MLEGKTVLLFYLRIKYGKKVMIHKIKLIIAFTLMICTCLPLGSCQKKALLPFNSNQNNMHKIEVEKPANIKPEAQTTGKDYLIPIAEIELNDPGSWVLFIAFIWPLPFLIAKQKICTSLIRQRIYRVVELCLSLLSAFIIYSFVFNLFYKPMFFGYIAFLLIITYNLLTVSEIVKPKAME